MRHVLLSLIAILALWNLGCNGRTSPEGITPNTPSGSSTPLAAAPATGSPLPSASASATSATSTPMPTPSPTPASPSPASATSAASTASPTTASPTTASPATYVAPGGLFSVNFPQRPQVHEKTPGVLEYVVQSPDFVCAVVVGPLGTQMKSMAPRQRARHLLELSVQNIKDFKPASTRDITIGDAPGAEAVYNLPSGNTQIFWSTADDRHTFTMVVACRANDVDRRKALAFLSSFKTAAMPTAFPSSR